MKYTASFFWKGPERFDGWEVLSIGGDWFRHYKTVETDDPFSVRFPKELLEGVYAFPMLTPHAQIEPDAPCWTGHENT